MDLKRNRTGIEKKFFELCQSVVNEQGLELYSMDYISGQQLLRLFVQNPETKTAQLDDCAKIDRALTPFIEEEDWMPEELTLEVSSPGVYRDVKEAIAFESLVGERVAMGLHNKISDQDILSSGDLSATGKKLLKDKKVIVWVEAFGDDHIVVKPDGGDSEKDRLKINFENIKKANVEPRWEDIKDS